MATYLVFCARDVSYRYLYGVSLFSVQTCSQSDQTCSQNDQTCSQIASQCAQTVSPCCCVWLSVSCPPLSRRSSQERSLVSGHVSSASSLYDLYPFSSFSFSLKSKPHLLPLTLSETAFCVRKAKYSLTVTIHVYAHAFYISSIIIMYILYILT